MSDSNPPTMADVKAAMAAQGASVSPDAKLQVMEIDHSQPGHNCIVLERVKPNYTTDYCVHGYSQCVFCSHAVYLGSESIRYVKSGVLPMCHECAKQHVPEGSLPSGNVSDHKRTDGPHD